jgi:hypothetical protein
LLLLFFSAISAPAFAFSYERIPATDPVHYGTIIFQWQKNLGGASFSQRIKIRKADYSYIDLPCYSNSATHSDDIDLPMGNYIGVLYKDYTDDACQNEGYDDQFFDNVGFAVVEALPPTPPAFTVVHYDFGLATTTADAARQIPGIMSAYSDIFPIVFAAFFMIAAFGITIWTMKKTPTPGKISGAKKSNKDGGVYNDAGKKIANYTYDSEGQLSGGKKL